MAVETVEIQEQYTKKAVRALKQEESDMALHLKAMGEKLKVLMGEIKDAASSGSSGRHAGNRAGDEKRTWNVTLPPKRPFRERMPDQRYGRTLGKRTEESVMVGNELYLP